jgi:hypothetical protein
VYHSTVSNPRFTTLEPPAKAGRVGGRGKDKRDKVIKGRKRVKDLFLAFSEDRVDY